MNTPRITWKGAALLGFAVLLSYLGAQILREAAKELAITGGGVAVLGGLVSLAAHRLPPLPE